jgi:hypothetical protein
VWQPCGSGAFGTDSPAAISRICSSRSWSPTTRIERVLPLGLLMTDGTPSVQRGLLAQTGDKLGGLLGLVTRLEALGWAGGRTGAGLLGQ